MVMLADKSKCKLPLISFSRFDQFTSALFFSGTDPVIEWLIAQVGLVITNRSILNMPVAKHLNF